MTARDYLGQELEVGDMVVFTYTGHYGFQRAIIKSIDEKDGFPLISLEGVFEQRYGNQVIKIGVLAND